MPENQWTRVVELFESAMTRPAGEREPWVRSQCGDDTALLAEVCSLLDAAQAETEAAKKALPPGSVEGRRYGPWESVRLLGSGGMGSVLLVKRVDGEFEQTAALKLMAPHFAGPYFLERFRIERQILARLNHPNITKLIDGGVTADGAPYLVMEFVDGLAIDAYADSRKLNVRERVQLFLKICDAVEFAHRNLIVHRDLKPSNILVETATGEPKLLDFGTARLLPEAGRAVTTITLNRLVTPRYASPEALRHAPITTQADVFSLGIILYEQITGAWPFGELASPVVAMEKITQGVLEPPDSRLTQEVAEARSTSMRVLRGIARGDLANILHKATRPELEERYKSVEELAQDLRAYLDGRPVTARAMTPWYRASKFLRKYWVPATALAAMVVGLTAASLSSYRWARQAERDADRSFVATMALQNLITSASAASTEHDVKLSELAAHGDDAIAGSDPSMQAELLISLAFVDSAAGDVAGGEKRAREAARLARASGQSLVEADALVMLARIQSGSVPAEALTAARRALELSRSENSRNGKRIRFLANANIAYAAVLMAGDTKEIRECFREAIRLGNSDPFLKQQLPSLYAMSAYFHGNLQEREAEMQDLQEGLAIFRALPRPFLADALILDQYRARLDRDGDYDGAERFARERLDLAVRINGPDHYMTLDPRIVWAMQLRRKGNLEEASQQLALGRAQYAKMPAKTQAGFSWKLFAVSAYIENRRGKAVEAERFARIARDNGLALKWSTQNDPRMAEAFFELGLAYRQQGRFDEARKELTASRQIYQIAWGAEHRRTKMAATELALAEAHDSSIPK